MTTQEDRVRTFRQLHESGCFVLPNPWDIGSARALENLGFPAIATTSSGFAWSLGRRDNNISVDEAIVHMAAISRSVRIPVNADFEGGFASDPEGLGANVARAVRTGIAGLSIEDSTGDAAHPLYEFDVALARIRSAREAIDSSGSGVLLTARTEGFLVGVQDLRETVRRLVAFAEAGADCLYAPLLRDPDQIRTVVDAVQPKPVNVLAWTDFTTVSELAALGVRRISVGGALARSAWTAFLDSAREIATSGTFAQMGRAHSSAVIMEAIEGRV